MSFRDYVTAAGLAVSLSLMPACEKKASKPDDVECVDNKCRDMYRDQDNGLKVPNVYKDKRLERLEGKLGSEKLTLESYDFAGDKQPDVLVMTWEYMSNGRLRSKKVMYFASKFDGKVTEAFVDDLVADGAKSEYDGYWDYKSYPRHNEKNLTIKDYFESAKKMIDDMNSKKLLRDEDI